MLLLSTAYFAPTHYYSALLSDDPDIVIEKHENYCRQSCRNRCTIYTANGLLDLTVPVVKAKTPKTPVTEVEISCDTQWQKTHFKAIESAYRRSPFYEYYMDDLMVFFTGRHRWLYELNMQILHTVCRLMHISPRFRESEAYTKTGGEGTVDLRNSIHPKKAPPHAMPRYTQVFSEKWGFKPGLSILDLLFNTGTDAKRYLHPE